MPTPEIPLDQKVTERPEGPNFSETLQQAGIQSTPANVKPVVNDQGQQMITTPATQGAKIQIPGDKTSLIAQAKGSVTNAATWLAKFLLRMIEKKEVGSPQSGEESYASNNTE